MHFITVIKKIDQAYSQLHLWVQKLLLNNVNDLLYYYEYNIMYKLISTNKTSTRIYQSVKSFVGIWFN